MRCRLLTTHWHPVQNLRTKTIRRCQIGRPMDYNREAQGIVDYQDSLSNSHPENRKKQAGIRLKNRYTNWITYWCQNNFEVSCSHAAA